MKDRKDQILATASELLECRSFSSFSYKDLSERLGIAKASIHHHFPTKESLGMAVLDRLYRTYERALEDISRRSAAPWEQLEAYVTFMSGFARGGDRICASGMLQAEYNVIPESMQARLCRQCRLVQAWLAGVLQEGRKAGVMAFHGSEHDQAMLVYATIQGALQSARAQGPEVFSAISNQLRRAMENIG